MTDALAEFLKKYPPVWRRLKTAFGWYYRASMYPLGPKRRAGVAQESASLVADTEKLNVAAEQYFQTFDNPEFLLAKPFSDSEGFARHLFSLGAVLMSIGIRNTDVVLEFGAGTCWVSHFLNKFGCKTYSVDVSPTALALGRQMFDRDPFTRHDAMPEFLPYDGHRLPLPDASCDKVVIFDAFHHIPNQREILSELHRVLRPNGIVGMSEPGLGHAESDASKKEVAQFGVLENELVIEDVGALAKACGFKGAFVVATSPDSMFEVPTEDFAAFLGGKDFIRYWPNHTNALLVSHYIVLYKGDPRPSTRRARGLLARVTTDTPLPLRVRAGEPARLSLSLFNPTETRWLAAEGEGWTRLGAHLYRDASPRELIDFDWMRAPLPADVECSRGVTLHVELPPIAEPGAYLADLDLVIEGVAWFESRGSQVLTLPIVVTP